MRTKKYVRISVSMAKDDLDKLRKLSDEEKRPQSLQLVYMMEYYLKNRKGN